MVTVFYYSSQNFLTRLVHMFSLKDALYFIWQVIYGDTDSIMIYSGVDDIAKAKAIAGKVIQEVGLWSCKFQLE